MKITVSEKEALDALRWDSVAEWGSAAAKALTAYLFDEERRLGQELEFNRVELRETYAQHVDALGAARAYSLDNPTAPPPPTTEEEAWEYITDRTVVIPFDGGIIIKKLGE